MTITHISDWQYQYLSIVVFEAKSFSCNMCKYFHLLVIEFSAKAIHSKLEKVAIATHCNLRPPDVSPVVLGFNNKAHNALDYRFKQSPKRRRPMMHQHSKFQLNPTIRGGVNAM